MMSQHQYNFLMSSMLNQKHALAKLRAELEERPGKLCYEYKKFGHLAYNCRNRKEGEKRMLFPQNRFEILLSRVMKCRVKIRRQEEDRRERVVQTVTLLKVQPKKELVCSIRRNAQENEIRCFECKRVGHQYKDCPNRRLEREKAACVVIPQKM